MSNLRDEVFEWAESGHLKPGDAARALDLAGLRPGLSDWRRFLDTLLLWVGVLLVASGVIFFFAYNWQSMHRFGKFGLCEAAFVIALVAAWLLGTESALGKGAVVGAALMTGALLALVGQTYQTGAAPYELFGAWALLILPWVALARFAPLWLLWLGLLNLSVGFYFAVLSWGLFGMLFGLSGSCWSLLALNVAALVLWEAGIWCGISWLDRWGARGVGVLAGGGATVIGVFAAAGSPHL